MSASGRERRRESHGEQLADYEHGADAPLRATESALVRADGASSIVLVEGISDQIAIETLAERLGRNLADNGIVVVPIGGAQAIDQFASRFGEGVALIGLCDRAEAADFERVLTDFHVCDADLEDELIRAVGRPEIESVLTTEGDLGAFHTFQKQPAWRDQPFEAQMRRWLGSVSRRKSRYARLFVLASSLERMPRPLIALIDDI